MVGVEALDLSMSRLDSGQGGGGEQGECDGPH